MEPLEAEGVRTIYRALVAEQLRCRPIPKRLNTATTPTPTGTHQVWQTATGSHILTHRTYAGQARYHYRRLILPPYRKTAAQQLQSLKTGRSARAASAWMRSEAPAIIPRALGEKAQGQGPRNAAAAQKRYQPAAGRDVLRTLVQCGACGLGMVGRRQRSAGKQDHALSSQCTGHAPLTVGRTTRC